MHVYNVWIYIYKCKNNIHIYIHTCAYYVYHRFVWTIGDTFSVTPGVALFVTGLILGCFSTGQPNGPADGPDEHAKNTLPKFNMVHLKMAPRKRRFLLETIIFRFHVKLGECRVFILQLLLATSICHCKSTERSLLFLKNAEGGISHSILKIKEPSHFWGIFMCFSFGWYTQCIRSPSWGDIPNKYPLFFSCIWAWFSRGPHPKGPPPFSLWL